MRLTGSVFLVHVIPISVFLVCVLPYSFKTLCTGHILCILHVRTHFKTCCTILFVCFVCQCLQCLSLHTAQLAVYFDYMKFWFFLLLFSVMLSTTSSNLISQPYPLSSIPISTLISHHYPLYLIPIPTTQLYRSHTAKSFIHIQHPQ